MLSLVENENSFISLGPEVTVSRNVAKNLQ